MTPVLLGLMLLTDPLGPGRYCAYDTVSEISPTDEVVTVVEVGDGERPNVSVSIGWPQSDKVFELRGIAEAGVDGALRFRAEDGWGNRSIVVVYATGELDFDLAAPPDNDKGNVTFFYSGTMLGECRRVAAS